MGYNNVTINTFKEFNITPDWSDILFAVQKNWLSPNEVEEFATNFLVDNNCNDENIILLASSAHEMGKIQIEDILMKIQENKNDAYHMRWLYIILKQLWNSPFNYEEKLNALIEIYADFDYPDIMRPFIRYIPPEDGYNPSQHSHENNIKRLIDLWEVGIKKIHEQC